jgi:hypothetical protein
MNINEAIKTLSEANELHLELGKKMLEAYQGAIYHMDLFAAAVLNRSLYLIEGFSKLIIDRNYISAVPLLRLQLDNALRFQAAWLVDEPNQFVADVMKGKKIKNIKDSHGNMMTDKYLVSKLSKEYNWIEKVYKDASGFIHLSETHILNAIHHGEEEREFIVNIGRGKIPIPDETFLNLIGAFMETTKIVLKYINNWVYTKNHPEVTKRDI